MNAIEKIEWNPSFSVGVAFLDEQHRVITGVINELAEHAQVAVGSEVISEVLDRLTHFASIHFKAEEALLAEHDYPDLEAQKSEHLAYRLKIATLCQETVLHKNTVPEDLIRFLRNWWVDHILDSDMKYRSFFAERGVV